MATRTQIAVSSVVFALLFAGAFHLWWGFVLVAPAPLAALVGSGRAWWAAACLTLAASAAWVFVYWFLAAFSVAGLVAVSVYHGLTVALAVAAAGWWTRRTALPTGLPFALAWTGGEFLRMLGPFGFPLGILATPAHRQLWMIQVSDLGGPYVLSFAIALLGATVGDVLRSRPWGWSRARSSGGGIPGRLRRGIVATAGVWAFVATYGVFRLAESGKTMTAGPAVAVVQPDVIVSPGGGHGSDPRVYLDQMLAFSDQALGNDPRPEIVLWPEALPTMPYILPGGQAGAGLAGEFDRKIRSWVDRNDTPVLVGLIEELPPRGNPGAARRFLNTAVRYLPGEGRSTRKQSKVRLFPVGEFIPWEGSVFHRWVQEISGLRGWGGAGEWVEPGAERKTFDLAAGRPGACTYAVSICSEVLFPDASATFLRGRGGAKAVDALFNINNLGGFMRNPAMVFHSYLLPFRAVEARVGIARCSNTGISGFVKPSGEFYGEVTNARGQTYTGRGAPELDLIEEVVRVRREREHEIATDRELRREVADKIAEIRRLRAEAGVEGVSVATLWSDPRRTLYGRIGDVFGWVMLGLLATGLLGAAVEGAVRAGRRCKPG